ncbi:MAG: KH domain-containing protein [Chloroflexi bacterium]|jgi:spoIIIJ-associated protein|nr:KH domain-containing protein [Chloroflexota bacterium]
MSEKHATLEVIAPSIDEAIEKGLSDLGLVRAAVDVKVLDEGSTGLFGLGSRQARIMLIVKDDAEPVPAAVSAKEADTSSSTESTASVASSEDQAYTLQLVHDILRDLLDKMHLEDTKIDTYLGEPYGPLDRVPVHADISGDDLSVLIGSRGETLEALQYIARLMLGKELERAMPLVIDVEGFRQRRSQQISRLARRVAEQVAQTGRSQSLEPMPANERRIAHLELQDDSSVYTESVGTGRNRKVVIYQRS